MPSKVKVGLRCSQVLQTTEPGFRLQTMVPESHRKSEVGFSSRFSPQKAIRVRVSESPLCTPSHNDMTGGSRSSQDPAKAPGSRCGFPQVIKGDSSYTFSVNRGTGASDSDGVSTGFG